MFLGRRIFRLRLPIGERQELVDSAHRMTGDDPGEHVAQVGFRINAIHLAGLDERSNDGPVFTTPIRSCKKMILPAKCNRAHCAFDNIGIDFNATVIKEAREPFPA